MPLDEIIKALSHPVRRDILRSLKNPEEQFPGQVHSYELGVCAGRIEQRIGLSQSTVSTHLAILQRAGLIRCRKVGQWSYFLRDEDAIRSFVTALGLEL